MDLTFPNHQVNHKGDEAHGDKCEGHHQPVRCILKQEFLLCTVVEVVGVDVEEDVLSVGVRVIAADDFTQLLQAICQVTVWSVTDAESKITV